MPTLSIVKDYSPEKEKGGGQLRPALPGLRISVQPAAALRPAVTQHRRLSRVLPRPPVAGERPPLARWLVLRQGPGAGELRGAPFVVDEGPGPATVIPPASDPAPAISPVDFARDVLGVRLWHKQEEVLTALTRHRRVAVKAGNGLGKGFCASVALLWFMHVHPAAAIALCTAPTFRQVRHVLWRQVRRLYRPVATTLGGEMLQTRWDLDDDRYALGLSADGADQFQGFHSPHMLIVVDEAEGVGEEIYEAIESVMTSADPLLLLIGNPTSSSGAFRRAFHEEQEIYRTITISALESPNVQAGRIVFPGLTTAAWVEERKKIWKEKSHSYRARVLGEFPDQGEDALLAVSDLERAVRRIVDAESWTVDSQVVLGSERQAAGEVTIAVDVARFGSDSSVILRRRGDCVEDIQSLQQQDTMQLTGRIAAAIREHNPARVLIDEIGVGAGVVDRLRELGHPVQGVNVARRAREDNQFINLRAEGYWTLAGLFQEGRINIPDDSELISQLSALRYSYDSQGRIKIESKDELRRRKLPSPDKADALMLAFLPPVNKVQIWI